MICRDLMKMAKSISAESSVLEAAKLMRDYGIGFLPVCHPQAGVIGTLTDRDIAVRVVAGGLPTSRPVAEVMSHDVVTCLAEEDVAQAEELMSQHQISRIVCVDDQGRLEGVISLSDIAQIEYRSRAADTLRNISEREAH